MRGEPRAPGGGTRLGGGSLAFLRAWNDGLDDDRRQSLIPRAHACAALDSTRDGEARRCWIAADWLAREHTMLWLAVLGFDTDANRLAALGPVEDAATAERAEQLLSEVLDRLRECGEALRGWHRPLTQPVDVACSASRTGGGDAALAAVTESARVCGSAAVERAARAAACETARHADDQVWARVRSAAMHAGKQALAEEPTRDALAVAKLARSVVCSAPWAAEFLPMRKALREAENTGYGSAHRLLLALLEDG